LVLAFIDANGGAPAAATGKVTPISAAKQAR
jgi:hypothetical protein